MSINPRFNLTHYLDVAIAAIVTLGVAIAVLNYNVISNHDGFWHLIWGYYWNQQILEGWLYPKWFEEAFGGLGTPSFVFYPPLFRLLSLPFAILHLSPSQQIKGGIILVLVLNAIGVIKLSRVLFHKNSLYSCISIFLGIFNPYLIIDIFKRGAFPESLAIALVPWLTLGIYQVVINFNIKHLILLTLGFAALFLAHLPSSVIFVSSFLLSVIILIALGQIKWQQALMSLLSPLFLAIALDAFFVLPVLVDAALIKGAGRENITDKFFLNGILNFRLSLVQLDWEKSLSRTFFLNLAILIIAVLFTRHWRSKNPKHILLNQQIIMVAFAVFMMTDVSLFMYEKISTFKKIQFPWRFLMLTSSLTPYIFSYTLEGLREKFSLARKQFALIVICTAVLFFTYKSAKLYLIDFKQTNLQAIEYLVTNRAAIPPETLQNIKNRKVGDYHYFELGRRTFVYLDRDLQFFQSDVMDYLPITVQTKNWLSPRKHSPRIPPQPYQLVEFVEGDGKFSIQDWHQGQRLLKLNATTAVVLNIRTFYYPGWGIQITPPLVTQSQETLLFAATDGRMQLRLSPGTYDIRIWYRGTATERTGTLISWVTLLLLLSVYLRKQVDTFNLNISEKNM
ncbi:hypothetical protein [Microseira wollei]|uniref:Membrane protein 6-pyruvoyl-tetrahydropterin synthase-related domain-containing protein n=1 Tax=Microseira wollei NIES-4236 TaxID=2530354 RepID=A0AAV3X5I4_9CYAN|nr:hypothetical protein [Microseira wollei]GET35452.1 hypothetical protein MiSe_01940 [Microseira wollei NIES-4236]